MKPDDIRRLYAAEDPATDAEARATEQEARSDPDQARRLIMTLYALASEDRDFDRLLTLALKAGLMQLIVVEAERDDRFALEFAGNVLDLMRQLARPPRGKPRTAKTA